MTTGELIKILADYCPDTPIVTPLFAGDERTTIIGSGYEHDVLDTLSLFLSEDA